MTTNARPDFLKTILFLIGYAAIVLSASAQKMDAKSRALLERLEARIGTYADLPGKGDIELKYNYDAVGRGQNISLKRHIYDGEHSWASFQTHFIKEFDATAGTLQQSLVNNVTTAKVGEAEISGPEVDQSVRFHRQVNFYWLTMMYKLRDSGTIFKHLGAHQENGVTYEKVHLTYDPANNNIAPAAITSHGCPR